MLSWYIQNVDILRNNDCIKYLHIEFHFNKLIIRNMNMKLKVRFKSKMACSRNIRFLVIYRKHHCPITHFYPKESYLPSSSIL
jgi:hypothetical protein